MCVDVVKSIALNPTRSITGAMVSVLAVSTPSAAQRHWLPSRSDVSTSWMSATAHLHFLCGTRFEPAREVAGVDAAGLELGVAEHIRVEREIRGDAGYACGADCLAQFRERRRAIGRV